jgi:hypothetical protein
MDNGLSQIQQGELVADIKYLKSCCERVEKDMEAMRNEQLIGKNRLNATLVGVIVTLAFLALTYFR